MTQATTSSGLIRPIQYLRGLAALMVVWHHGVAQTEATIVHVGSAFGRGGVDLFFVISGFIMVVTTANKRWRPEAFMMRRVIRVAPLYWLVTLFIVATHLLAPHTFFQSLQFSAGTVLKSLLFVPHYSYGKQSLYPVLFVGWTLNFEMFFYALFALSLVFSDSLRMYWLIAVMCGLVIIGRLFGPFISPVAQTYLSPLLLEFLAGTLIAHCWLRKYIQIGLFFSAFLICTGLAFLWARDSLPLLDYTPLLGAALVVVGVLHPAILRLRLVIPEAIGDASYSIYLTHVLTVLGLRVAWIKFVPSESVASSVAFLGLVIVTCAAVGWVTFMLIERPMTHWLNKFFERVMPRLKQKQTQKEVST